MLNIISGVLNRQIIATLKYPFKNYRDVEVTLQKQDLIFRLIFYSMQTTISTIIPVYNGAKYLPELASILAEAREHISNNFDNIILLESIFIIDEAIDNSLSVLRGIKKKHDWVHTIELSKNFGQHSATVAGILHSSGDWVVTLDEDLQHHPKYILELLYQTVSNEKDICYGHPIHPAHNSIVRDKVSVFFKKIVGYLSDSPNVKYYNSYRCLRGSIARAASSVCGPDTYFDVVLGWFTQRVTIKKIELIDVRNNSIDLESGYSFWQLIKHGKRMIMSSKLKFLRVVILVGVLSFVVSSVYAIYVLTIFILGIQSISVAGWPSLIISIFFFGGINSLMLGIIIESISDILLKSKGKPTYYTVNRENDKALFLALDNFFSK